MTESKSQIWRVNVREQTLKREPVPESWKRLGGRGLLARILLDEVDAKCDPLGCGEQTYLRARSFSGAYAFLHRPDFGGRQITVDRWNQGSQCRWTDRPSYDPHGHPRPDY